jgi:O-antigen biosynthesis protein
MNTKYDYSIDMSQESSHTLILKQVKPGTRVLEFGPATGYMTRYMKEELGCTVVCIEIDPAAAQLAQKFADKMIVANLDSMTWVDQLGDQRFDYLMFADVLEHLIDPWNVLKTATNFLEANGSVLISVPNVGHNALLMDLLEGKFDYRQTGLLDDTHLRFFTRKSVLDLLAKAGLCSVELLGTTIGPEDTELMQSYNDFPQSMQRFLRRKIDAHIYQYIVVAKKLEATLPGECTTELKCRESQFPDGFLQVYWGNNGDFSESKSAIVPLQRETGFATYELEVPGGFADLRIDPINYSSYVEISCIELLEKAEGGKFRKLGLWSAVNRFPGLTFGANVLGLYSEQTLRLAALDDDSNIQLGLKRGQGSRTLRVTMRVDRNLDDILVKELQEHEHLLSILQTEVEEQATELNKSLEELENLKTLAANRQLELNRIKHSRGWKIARLLGRVTSGLRRILAPVIAPFIDGNKQSLIPSKNIRYLAEKGSSTWEANDKDPQFLLSGPWPTGWTEITWTAASDQLMQFKLYFDRGRGFNETESLSLGLVAGNEPTRYSSIVLIGKEIQAIRLDPGEGKGEFVLSDFKIHGSGRSGILLKAIKLHVRDQGMSSLLVELAKWFRQDGFSGVWKWAKKRVSQKDIYDLWLNFNTLTEEDKQQIVQRIDELKYKPTFSVIVPVYNVSENWLRKCIDSVQAQLYPYWELCIADDASTDPSVKKVLEEYAKVDSRIKVSYREENGHISAASNTALELATGEFIALLDNDDELTPDALYENALEINRHPDADMIYSDEDKITEQGKRHEPFYKPDWSPDTFLSMMYTCHLGVYRTELIRKIGSFRIGLEGSQDYDLVLRLTEHTKKIYHIPKILYHWRTIELSTAVNPESKNYAFEAGKRALEEALERRGEDGWVEPIKKHPGRYLIHHQPTNQPLISILIPTRDMPQVLGPCLQSVFDKTSYKNFEVIVIDNGSSQRETLALFKMWQQKEPERFRVLRLDIPFNYSVLNNRAVEEANGELVLLLNNDVEVITPTWLEEMAGQAVRSTIGAVGVMLLYPDRTLQHAGVVVGLGGVAGHSHKGFPEHAPGYYGRLLSVSNYSAVTAACLMIRKTVFQEVNGLEESLQVAFNDVDFCLKVLSKGYYNVVLPQVKLYHYESKSRGFEDTPEKMKRFMGEINQMKERWGEGLLNDPFYNPNLTLFAEDFSLAIPPRV